MISLSPASTLRSATAFRLLGALHLLGLCPWVFRAFQSSLQHRGGCSVWLLQALLYLRIV